MPRHIRSAFLSGLAVMSLLSGLPLAAQPACAPDPFADDGFVTAVGDRLMVGGQTLRLRGVNFTGGRGTPQFPLKAVIHPDGSAHDEEVYPYTPWTSSYDSERTYAELALLRDRLGINALRVLTPRPSAEPPYGDDDPAKWFLPGGSIKPLWLARFTDFLCSCRRLGLKVQVSLLLHIERDGNGAYANLPYPPEFVTALDTYLASFVPHFAGDPTILAWEISNETLSWTADPQPIHAEVLKLTRHLSEEVRLHDPNHLLTSGEVAVPTTHATWTSWRYPTPELARFDLDGTGTLTGLVDLVDYLSPHFYSFGYFDDVNGSPFDFGPMTPVVAAIKKQTTKPVAMGEMNRAMGPGHQGPDEDDAIRRTFFELARDAMVNACRNDPSCPDGRTPGGSGYLAWEAEPILDLRPGAYVREWHCKSSPPEPIESCDVPWPYLRFLAEERGVHYQDSWELLYYPTAASPTLEPLAPGRVLRTSLAAAADFGGNGSSDLALFRPASGQWLVPGKGPVAFGAASDRPLGLDWDGDGRAEPAFFRPASLDPGQPAAEWWFLDDREPTLFGHAGDLPVPADYDGDGDREIAIFRPHADDDPNVAAWFVRGQISNQHYGQPTDVPVPADYDGDGDADLAVYRPASGQWFVRGQVNGTVITTPAAGDLPVPADYDADGAADLALFRPGTGEWFVDGVLTGLVLTAPQAGDLPVPADYDGDGATEPALFRPSTGQWFFADGSTASFGSVGDMPVVRVP